MRAVVYREHTLGLIDDSGNLQVLHVSVLRGAPNLHFVPQPAPAEIRPATIADFNDYRVKWHPDYILKG